MKSDSTTMNFSLLIKMTASTRLTLYENLTTLYEISLGELKFTIVKSIQPLMLKNRVKKFYYRSIGASFSSEQLLILILSEFEKHSTFLDERNDLR